MDFVNTPNVLDFGQYKIRKCCDKLKDQLEWYNEEGAIWISDEVLYYAYTLCQGEEQDDYYGEIEECDSCGNPIIIYQLLKNGELSDG